MCEISNLLYYVPFVQYRRAELVTFSIYMLLSACAFTHPATSPTHQLPKVTNVVLEQVMILYTMHLLSFMLAHAMLYVTLRTQDKRAELPSEKEQKRLLPCTSRVNRRAEKMRLQGWPKMYIPTRSLPPSNLQKSVRMRTAEWNAVH